LRLLRRLLRDLGSGLSLGEDEVTRINDQYFTLGSSLMNGLKVKEGLVYAGCYLGRDRRRFEPSSILLQTLASEPGTRKVHVGRDAAWLWVCGRDVFQANIEAVEGELTLGSHCLVVHGGRCIGYGRYETAGDRRIVRNLFDLGDFLRRET
jgi:ribosome biogenesis protein Nip4